MGFQCLEKKTLYALHLQNLKMYFHRDIFIDSANETRLFKALEIILHKSLLAGSMNSQSVQNQVTVSNGAGLNAEKKIIDCEKNNVKRN